MKRKKEAGLNRAGFGIRESSADRAKRLRLHSVFAFKEDDYDPLFEYTFGSRSVDWH
jgi:hypothetical protein